MVNLSDIRIKRSFIVFEVELRKVKGGGGMEVRSVVSALRVVNEWRCR
jgi:hypothetical protein